MNGKAYKALRDEELEKYKKGNISIDNKPASKINLMR